MSLSYMHIQYQIVQKNGLKNYTTSISPKRINMMVGGL